VLIVFNFCENRCVVFVDEGRKWSLSGRISDTVFSSDYSLKAWCFAISIESGVSHSDGTSQNLQKSFSHIVSVSAAVFATRRCTKCSIMERMSVSLWYNVITVYTSTPMT